MPDHQPARVAAEEEPTATIQTRRDQAMPRFQLASTVHEAYRELVVEMVLLPTLMTAGGDPAATAAAIAATAATRNHFVLVRISRRTTNGIFVRCGVLTYPRRAGHQRRHREPPLPLWPSRPGISATVGFWPATGGLGRQPPSHQSRPAGDNPKIGEKEHTIFDEQPSDRTAIRPPLGFGA